MSWPAAALCRVMMKKILPFEPSLIHTTSKYSFRRNINICLKFSMQNVENMDPVCEQKLVHTCKQQDVENTYPVYEEKPVHSCKEQHVKPLDSVHKIGKLSNVAYFLISNRDDLDPELRISDQSLFSMTEEEILQLDEVPPKKRFKKPDSPYEMLHEIAIAEDELDKNNSIFPFECENQRITDSIFSYHNEWTRDPLGLMNKESFISDLKMKMKWKVDEELKSVDHIFNATCERNVKKPEKEPETWLNLGKEMQGYIVDHINNHHDENLSEPSLAPKFSGYWRSIKAILPNFHNVISVDFQTEHPFLKYTTTADLICYYKNEVTVVSWKPFLGKTSNQKISNQPMKVMACVGALNFDPNFQMRVTKGTVVISYPSGAPAHILDFDGQSAWDSWITKIRAFYRNNMVL